MTPQVKLCQQQRSRQTRLTTQPNLSQLQQQKQQQQQQHFCSFFPFLRRHSEVNRFQTAMCVMACQMKRCTTCIKGDQNDHSNKRCVRPLCKFVKENKSMTPVLAITMLAVARTCFGFQLYPKQVGNYSVHTQVVLFALWPCFSLFHSLLADLFCKSCKLKV